MVIPVSLAGLVTLWGMAIGLVGWETLGGPQVVGKWGLMSSAAAAAWTVLYGLARHYQMVRTLIVARAGEVRNLHG